MSRVEDGISSGLGRKTLRRAGGGEERNLGSTAGVWPAPGRAEHPRPRPSSPLGPGRDPPPAAWGEGGAPALTSGEGFKKATGAEEIPNAGAEPQRSRQLFPAASCPSPTRRRDAVVPPAVCPGPALHRPGRRHRLGRPLGPAAPAVPAEVPGCRRREAGESPATGRTPRWSPRHPRCRTPLPPLPRSPASPPASPWRPSFSPPTSRSGLLGSPLQTPLVSLWTPRCYPCRFFTAAPPCPRSRPRVACCKARFPDSSLVPCQG